MTQRDLSRQQVMCHWLAEQLALPTATIEQNLTLIAGDASFRRYFRLLLPQQQYVVMDAPPDKENVRPFVAIARELLAAGLEVPVIYAEQLEQGFLLLSDLGDDLYSRVLNPRSVDTLYQRALEQLVVMQQCPHLDTVMGHYDDQRYSNEMAWFVEWFLEKYLQLDLSPHQKMLQATFRLLINSALAQPQVFTHRDYHSRNLLLLPNQRVGILDFQDAVTGAFTYDAVSLLRDSYIDWPAQKVVKLALYFREIISDNSKTANVSEEQFLKWFDWMGIQRHLKVTYNFARKFCRDQDPSYLEYLPRTLNYVVNISKPYAELKPLRNFIVEVVQPRVEQLQ